MSHRGPRSVEAIRTGFLGFGKTKQTHACCGQTFDEAGLAAHRQRAHAPAAPAAAPLSCCGMNFRAQAELEAHRQARHKM